MLIDHTNCRVLDVLQSREKPVLKAWLASARESGLLAELEEVTTDMWEGFTMAVREVLGSRVRIVIDRFHVMKHFQQRLNEARAQEPARFYSPQSRTLGAWREEDERLIAQQRATEVARDERKRALAALRQNPKASDSDIERATRFVERLDEQMGDFERRLKETHTIITGLMSKDTKTAK